MNDTSPLLHSNVKSDIELLSRCLIAILFAQRKHLGLTNA